MIDYYVLLNIPRFTNNQSEIKKAYHEKLKQFHPDMNKIDAEIALDVTIKLNKAYEILSSPETKKDYDIKLEQYLAKKQAYAASSDNAKQTDHCTHNSNEEMKMSSVNNDSNERVKREQYASRPTEPHCSKVAQQPKRINGVDLLDTLCCIFCFTAMLIIHFYVLKQYDNSKPLSEMYILMCEYASIWVGLRMSGFHILSWLTNKT